LTPLENSDDSKQVWTPVRSVADNLGMPSTPPGNPVREEMCDKIDRALSRADIPRTAVGEELAAVLGWLWQPFKPLVGDAKTHLDKQWAEKQLRAAGLTVLKRARHPYQLKPFLAEGHITDIKAIGGLAVFAQPFKVRLKGWDHRRPLWSEIEGKLLREHKVPARKLRRLTLLDIRRYLLSESSKPKKKKRGKRGPYKKKLTPKQMQALGQRLTGVPVLEIAKRKGTSKSNVQTLLKRALRNMKSLPRPSGKSMRASTNADDLEQRAQQSRRDDD